MAALAVAGLQLMACTVNVEKPRDACEMTNSRLLSAARVSP